MYKLYSLTEQIDHINIRHFDILSVSSVTDPEGGLPEVKPLFDDQCI